MKRKIVFALVVLTAVFSEARLYGQETKKIDWGLDGQLVLTCGSQAVFANFGGPGLKLNFKKWAISYNMMPSLKLDSKEKHLALTTALGTGPQLYFFKRRLVVSFPAYYSHSTHNWTFTAGIGYTFRNHQK